MKRTLITGGLAAVCLVGAVNAEPVNLKAGEWTYTLTMSVPGSESPPITETDSDCMQDWETQLEPAALAQEFAGGADCQALQRATKREASLLYVELPRRSHGRRKTVAHTQL